MSIQQELPARGLPGSHAGLRAWIAVTSIWTVCALGVVAIGTGLRTALNTSHDKRANTSAAMYTLLDTGSVIEAEIGRVVRPAIERTEILAKSSELIGALTSDDPASQTALLNSKITTATEIDSIALFNASGRIAAINTVYSDGRPIPKERVNRILGSDFSQRPIIQGCLRNDSKSSILEFQTHCDITPAFFDSTGLSVAYSVPVIDPRSGAKLGVISSRLRFERLSGLIEARTIGGGSARAYLVTDAGGYFSESINSGREQPPVPVAELRQIVRPILGDGATKAVTSRADKYLAVFSIHSLQTLEGGGIHILLIADSDWVMNGPRQERLIQALNDGLIGILLLAVAGLAHSRAASQKTRRILDKANEANAQLAAIVESSAEAIISDSLDGTIRSWNPGAERIFGYTAREAIGRDADLIESKDRPGEIARLRRDALAGASIEQFETRRRCKDGREIEISLSVSLIRNPGGEIVGISRIARDITPQKRVELELRDAHDQLEARVAQRTTELSQAVAALQQQMAEKMQTQLSLQQSEERFRQFAENTKDVFWMVTVDGNTVVYVSPEYERIWGRPCAELYQNAHARMDAIEPDDRHSVYTAWTGLSVGGEFAVEYRIRRPDGTIRWIRDRAIPIRDDLGAVYRIAGIAEDITSRRANEEQLRQAKETIEAANVAMRVVFDTALDAIITIDSHSVITAWNLQAETMFRWDSTEAVGMRVDQTIIPERQWDAYRREIENFLKTGEGPLLDKVSELVAIRRDGVQFPVELAITPASSGGQCTFTAFVRDITSRKQAEAELRHAKDAAENASRAKSEFLANMSHEIRTPLNGVIGMCGLLLDTTLDERQRRFAELIKSSGASLGDLINDILDFSKIEARKMEIESVDFDLRAVVEDVSETMSMKASSKGLDLACLTMPDVPRYVKGDSQRVKQILINLINNAIKFTESGSISVRLTLDAQSHEHAAIRFSVTDTGIGIPADRMDRLFKSFSQVDVSTTRTHGGTGLGLAISKQLAELMGGGVGVESAPGRGSTFWFTVRLRPGLPVLESLHGVAVDFSRLRVLAAHHDPMMGEILRGQLCSWRMDVAMASTGEEAMKALVDAAANSRPFDVAILDYDLGGVDTLQLGKAIKARFEIARTLLLILLPIASDLEPSKLAEAGFSGHLIKPVRQSRLYDVIVSAISSSSNSKPVAAQTLAIASLPPSHPLQAAQKSRILIAEDNPVNQIVASEVLAKYGYAYEIVGDGQRAVSAVSTGNYDLVLMDCLMPALDGFEATMQIRRDEQADPRRRRTPIIALTANAINGDRERCLAAGMDDYVSKPLDPNLLIEAIRKLLDRSDSSSSMPPVAEPSVPSAATRPAIAGDETPPMSIDALIDRCMGNVETVSLILDEFERQALADLSEIQRYMGCGDCKALSRVAHALKGASSVLSADALSKLAFNLERMGRSGVLVEQDQMLTQLENEVRRCVGYLPTARSAIAQRAKV